MLSPKSRYPLLGLSARRRGCSYGLKEPPVSLERPEKSRMVTSTGSRRRLCSWAAACWQRSDILGFEEAGTVELSFLGFDDRGTSVVIDAKDMMEIGLELVRQASVVDPPKTAHELALRIHRLQEALGE